MRFRYFENDAVFEQNICREIFEQHWKTPDSQLNNFQT